MGYKLCLFRNWYNIAIYIGLKKKFNEKTKYNQKHMFRIIFLIYIVWAILPYIAFLNYNFSSYYVHLISKKLENEEF